MGTKKVSRKISHYILSYIETREESDRLLDSMLDPVQDQLTCTVISIRVSSESLWSLLVISVISRWD